MTTHNSERLLEVTDAFYAAALGDESWDDALQGLADATGSRSGQLAVIHSDAAVSFNTMTNVDPGVPRFFPETININPRVALARTVPLLRATADWDFMTQQAYRRDQFCQEFLRPYDIPFVCLATLERNEQTFVALTVIRSHREGVITGEQKRFFEAVAPHVRAAVRTHTALAGRGIAVLTEAMQKLSIPAFICDQDGGIQMLTPAAEVLLSHDCGLEVRAGQLHASEQVDAKVLKDAITAATGSEKPFVQFCRTVVIRGRDPAGSPVVMDVLSLSPQRRYALHFPKPAPQVLIVVRGSRGSGSGRAPILAAAYGLTSAESEIALLLAEGRTTEAIAMRRGVAVGTVRAQIKTILGKVGVRRQIELIARLNQL